MLCEHEIIHIHQYFIVSEHAIMLYPVACAICDNTFVMGGKETVYCTENIGGDQGQTRHNRARPNSLVFFLCFIF